mmetsp:Transcript_13757/g.28859  ORF Transcript_13757/g.28859 Transcript_13757/m.28859 type:complete len:303 (-) Transcript_13757:293-1201(-)|eukprot:CAMPEP_0168178996 /NCGR_PEP_ID=MMETSP0139_2-20121125/9532_1 /TAXON_ID=44445 /ORGANISM="Pseudo-nitzschia australis, Strain 10249 10 AB" /LENGTH=302 /DNA_ID=CAMNT_0008098645 /DNA_START=117 /DNA_END=1025 /DNA_ORIENTATION=+
MGKKRDLSIFDAIEELDTQDRKADRKRRKETNAEKKRAQEVQSQSKIYNHLLESRILLQRAINKVNDGAVSSSNKSSFRETCNTLIEKLLQARNHLSGSPPSSESSAGDDDAKYEDLLRPSARANFHDSLQDEYEKHRDEWKRILNQKHKNLRLHSGVTAKSQFRIMDSSFWEQVEATMEYEEIRNKEDNNSSTQSGSAVLFDDSKVYQQLLKDFVANSTNSNSARAGENSAEALRSSTKYKTNSSKKNSVDRKASKGRKIRYKEIPKLVNFTFPLSRPNTSNLDTKEYFQSLFGGAGVSNK